MMAALKKVHTQLQRSPVSAHMRMCVPVHPQLK